LSAVLCAFFSAASTPTYHDKIMIAQEIQDEYETLHTDIEESIGIANL
jgi:hypothetical protein